MVILTFKPVWEPLIQAGFKRQTIRYNAGYWRSVHENRHLLEIYLGNPRIGSDARRVGVANWLDFKSVQGYDLTTRDAWWDGFLSLEKLLTTLSLLNGIEIEEVLWHEWAVIQFTFHTDTSEMPLVAWWKSNFGEEAFDTAIRKQLEGVRDFWSNPALHHHGIVKHPGSMIDSQHPDLLGILRKHEALRKVRT